MITREMKQQVRSLLAEHIGNPTRRAAREARQTYIMELVSATAQGDDTDRDAADWLARLRELCAPHLGVYEREGILGWYRAEETRLTKLIG